MKRRLLVLVALSLGATFAVTALSSGAAAGSARTVAKRKPAVWINGSGKQAQLPVRASKQVRALVKSAMRKLQASGDLWTCIGGTKDTSIAGQQRCNFSGSAGICIETSSNPNVTQVCKFNQASTGDRTNIAIALQVIVQKTSTIIGQKGQQIVSVKQSNTTKANAAFVVQILKQSFGQGASDENDNEINDQSAIESRAEAASVLPDFTPLMNKIQNVEPSTEGDDTSPAGAIVGDVTQVQQSQQTVRVCQGGNVMPGLCNSPAGMSSNNLSSVYQSLRQREKAKNANHIQQEQNPSTGTCDDEDPSTAFPPRNMCSFIDQNTTGGENVDGAAEFYRQFQSGAHAHSLTQRQDPTFDEQGLGHQIHQLSVGSLNDPKRNTIVTLQLGRQVQRAKDISPGPIVQFQDPRSAKDVGAFQTGTLADTWFGRQFGTQIQTINGAFTTGVDTQRQLLTYDGETTGTFDVLQRGVQNDRSAQNTCPSPAFPGSEKSCHVQVECASATTPSEGYEGESKVIPAFCEASQFVRNPDID
jgi:hypothetical protein